MGQIKNIKLHIVTDIKIHANMEQNSNPSGLCKMGCGSYGNRSYEGMCSECFKENVKRQQQSSPTAGRNSPGNEPPNLLRTYQPNVVFWTPPQWALKKEEGASTEIGIKEEPVSDHDEDMKVVDAVDEETQSEHAGSHVSNGSTFSHTFSRSPSFTGSFEGSFSGSLLL